MRLYIGAIKLGLAVLGVGLTVYALRKGKDKIVDTAKKPVDYFNNHFKVKEIKPKVIELEVEDEEDGETD